MSDQVFQMLQEKDRKIAALSAELETYKHLSHHFVLERDQALVEAGNLRMELSNLKASQQKDVRQQVEKFVTQTLCDQINRPVKLADRLYEDLHMDELNVVEISILLEGEFPNFEMPAMSMGHQKLFENLSTVQDLINLICKSII